MCNLLIAVILAASPPFSAQTLDGRTVSGRIVELDADQVKIQTADGPVSLAADELLHVSPQSAPAATTVQGRAWIDLVDGSLLVATQYTVSNRRARITLFGDRVVELPTSAVANVRLQPQSDELAAEWDRILEVKRDSDLLVVRKGDAVDYHRGVLHDVSESVVQFEFGAETLAIKRSKVHGLLYSHAPGGADATPICRIIDVTGSQWPVGLLSLPGDLQWTTPAGATLTLPLEMIAKIDFSGGKVRFLSDLKPEGVTFTPYFGTAEDLPSLAKFYAPRNDTNLESGPLKLDGETFRKGLALHSRTKVVYRLPGHFRRFQAVVGIDAGVRPDGHVRLVISGDDRVLLETDVTGADLPKPVDLDLTGVRRLIILVDFGEKLDVADHLDLCNARIVK